jgi:general secretion pathway protein H
VTKSHEPPWRKRKFFTIAAPATRERGWSGQGFTLFEMIIVLVVLALIAGIVVSRGPVHSRALDVRAAVSGVVAVLRGARGRAIAVNRPVLVLVNGTQGSLSVDGLPRLRLPAGMALAAAVGAQTVPGPRPAGISFAPDGSSSGGRILLADGARRMQVGVDWLTGRVSVANAP